MPVYVKRCDACGAIEEVHRPFARSDDPYLCQCGSLMRNKICRPAMVMTDQLRYRDNWRPHESVQDQLADARQCERDIAENYTPHPVENDFPEGWDVHANV